MARYGVISERGLRYGRSRAMVLDVYRPQARGPRPAVLVVHGGGWRSGDKGRMEHVSRAVAEAGFVAVNVNYSLAAWWRRGYPRQLNELRIAVRWVRRNSYRLGVDRGRIGAVGSSAGGHLAALVATRTSGSLSAGARVRAVATSSAPFDLVRPDQASLVPMIQTFLGCRSDVCLRRRAAASPTSHVTRDDPPMLIVNSDEELVPLAHGRHMAARLSMAGVTHRLRVLPGGRHATMYTATALGPSIAFLRRWLRRA